MKILCAQINPTVGALEANTKKILQAIEQGKKQKAEIVLFPELALTGYPPQDLLLLPHFIKSIQLYLNQIIAATDGISVVLGLPRENLNAHGKPLFNSAAVIHNKKLLGYQDKSLLPTYDVFDERRYFEPATENKVWKLHDKIVAITICEDIWHESLPYYNQSPLEELSKETIDLHLNLSSSPFSINKQTSRLKTCIKTALNLHCPLIYCNQVGGNDSLIFDGHSLYLDAKGNLLQRAKGFQEDLMLVDLSAVLKPLSITLDSPGVLFDALVLGLKDYFEKSGFKRACLGLSGGIDSAVVACIACAALGKENMLGIGMPSRYSSNGSVDDAKQLALNLGMEFRQIPIEEPFQSFLSLLEPEFHPRTADVTEENLQARIRGMILMAFSNKLGYINLSTGNKSELAMGYCTLYGDMCGGLAVIGDVTKQQTYAIAHWINKNEEIIPQSTLTKPPSAELRPNQKDLDTLPEYDVIENVIKAYLEEHRSAEEIANQYHYDIELVQSLIKRIHLNEYKRRQAPPALRVSEKAFSMGRIFPIVERSQS